MCGKNYSNYRVSCSECERFEDFEIYDDGWVGIKLDSSFALCLDCAKKDRPEYYYDYECVVCNRWFNQDQRISNYVENIGIICTVCVLNLVKMKITEAMNDGKRETKDT